MVSFAWWKTDAPSLNGAGIGLLRWRNHARSTLRKPDTLKISYHYGILKPAARNNAPDVASGATLQQMNRALKNLLLWLMISLLPIQGMAVVISASCGLAAASVQHGAMAHHAAPAHCPSDSVDHASDAGSDAAATHHASCSACAACCVGASAPPSTPAPAAGHAMSESCFAALGMTDNGFIPTGPERPPRFS